MTKLTTEQKNNLRNTLAENHLSKSKLTVAQLSELTGISTAVVQYYREKWGYASRRFCKRSKIKNQSIDRDLSLDQAIKICKENGLKVIKIVNQEL